MKRLVLLGASNARRGLPAIVAAAREAAGGPVRIFGAIGHGRSYGAASSVLGRRLPGILQSGIWPALESAADESCDAVLMDIGNDILYGFPASEILGWVGECISRLERLRAGITVMGLPVATIDRLGPSGFLMFRSILFPSSRLGLGRVRASVRKLDRALRRLTAEREFRFVEPRGEWYGFDPIHLRFRSAGAAWRQILGAPSRSGKRLSALDALRVRLARPEREAFFRFERFRAQPAIRLGDSSEISLY